jgi:polyhydroxyalkanoate synthesis repressor PhaR
MITVKRYRNRRLYHTGLKSFIVLSDLEQMVRRGEDFIVVDSATGEDITLSMLTAVISDGVHSWKDIAASKAVLRAVINLGGRRSMSILKNTVLAGIGFANITRKKAEELIEALIKSGELTKSEKKEAVMELLSKVESSGREATTKITKEAKDAGVRLSKEFEKTLVKIRPAKKTDIDSLSKKIDKLTRKLADLEKKLGDKN